ncbi:hypothetical protein PGTUg99_017613 [Puccinia graminis f. sp. tritici]|uniref:Dilute domain-containing protein n=1 Tax=Puccinia graminis f. sp. tritici TaxID=56615 RepID=A0A5B0LJV1_PUCGR|nr:hypothetical protein PGTUg99_017613 [Puccinia graminis f. sp. tritici]
MQNEPDPNYIDPLIALAPTPTNLSRLATTATAAATTDKLIQIKQVFTNAYLRAASTGDSDLLEWLLNKTTTANEHPLSPSPSSSHHITLLKPGQARQWIDLEARDEDGSPAIILAAAFGHAEAVRAIVDGLGDQVVDRRDAVGWTALHWAARNGDLTIVSYLLNHGASTSLVSFTDRFPSEPPPSSLHSRQASSCSNSIYAGSDSRSLAPSEQDSTSTTTTPHPPKRRRTKPRGLRPYDLAKRDEQGETIREIIRIAEQAKSSTIPPHSRRPSQASVRSLRLAEVQSEADLAKSEAKKIIQLARLSSKTLDIEPSLLGLEPESNQNQPIGFPSNLHHHHHHLQTQNQAVISGLMASFHDEWEQEQRAEEFEWERCQPDQMLVCSLEELEGVFEAVIKTIEPRQARSDRSVPANVLFFCARFAAHMGTVELLEEVLLGAVDRIEEMILARQENMANSTFWLFNSICLLYYIRREPLLNELTAPDIQLHFEDLVNEIYVFIIRDAERRLDKLIDSTILDFEPLPEMAVDFEPEGSWRFVRALTVKRNRTTSFRPAIPRFNTKLDTASSDGTQATSPTKPPSSTLSVTSFSSPGHGPRTTSAPNSSQPHSSLPSTLKTTKMITDLLSSVLYLLQAYEIHGSVIVQIFSQIFYWLSCETFNRIISRRKYLCRSKAMQIKLNVTTIEEWGRANRLPTGVVRKHLEPLNQLLKWIECLSASGARSFDQLIEIVSSLKTLNPAQLLKVSRDYRFEVDEPKLSEECRQYLVQTQQDWDRRRIQRVSELELDDKRSSSLEPGETTVSLPSSPAKERIIKTKDDGLAKAIQAIDAAFGSDEDMEAYGSYEPPVAPECLGELLDSRQMLPFGLPTATEVLLSFKKTVPFGSLKTYLIPDEPKPGSHWWASSELSSLSDDDESLSDDDDGDDQIHPNGNGHHHHHHQEPTDDQSSFETPRLKPSLALSSSPSPSSSSISKPTPLPSTNSHSSSSPSSSPPSVLTPTTPTTTTTVNKNPAQSRNPVVPIVPSHVLKRIDRCLFKSNTAST